MSMLSGYSEEECQAIWAKAAALQAKLRAMVPSGEDGLLVGYLPVSEKRKRRRKIAEWEPMAEEHIYCDGSDYYLEADADMYDCHEGMLEFLGNEVVWVWKKGATPTLLGSSFCEQSPDEIETDRVDGLRDSDEPVYWCDCARPIPGRVYHGVVGTSKKLKCIHCGSSRFWHEIVHRHEAQQFAESSTFQCLADDHEYCCFCRGAITAGQSYLKRPMSDGYPRRAHLYCTSCRTTRRIRSIEAALSSYAVVQDLQDCDGIEPGQVVQAASVRNPSLLTVRRILALAKKATTPDRYITYLLLLADLKRGRMVEAFFEEVVAVPPLTALAAQALSPDSRSFIRGELHGLHSQQ